MVNAKNEVYWIHKPEDAKKVESKTSLSRGSVTKRHDITACGMEGDKRAHFFWVEERRGVLTTINREGVKESRVYGTLL